MADEVKRDEKGRLTAGGANLRSVTRATRAKVITRRLRKEYERRYSNEPLADGEVLGPERARLKHYFVAMDIMQSTEEAAKDRLKAAELLANRMDGKPVDEVELSGAVETGTPLDKAIGTLTPEQLLELVRAARGH